MPRSIPAWAGETCTSYWPQKRTGVYPRVGGGNMNLRCSPLRMYGLSPRGRGKLDCREAEAESVGSIPAWAGETYFFNLSAIWSGVYPRVGGGNGRRHIAGLNAKGLSPRGRGKPAGAWATAHIEGSIPAWAGETGCPPSPSMARAVYPRVGGGNMSSPYSDTDMAGLSPRGRGKRQQAPTAAPRRWSIPAWAGETIHSPNSITGLAVYPRVGGGNA